MRCVNPEKKKCLVVYRGLDRVAALLRAFTEAIMLVEVLGNCPSVQLDMRCSHQCKTLPLSATFKGTPKVQFGATLSKGPIHRGRMLNRVVVGYIQLLHAQAMLRLHLAPS